MSGLSLFGSGLTITEAQGPTYYLGTWDASTNTPTLASSTAPAGPSGSYYIVSVAGTTNLNGITDWTVGDWVIWSGSVWQKLEGGMTSVTVGSTLIAGGTTGRVLYDNAGVLGEMTNTGTGTVNVLQTSPALITPALGIATGTSLALGGATIGTNALAVTGTTAVAGAITPTVDNTNALGAISFNFSQLWVRNIGSGTDLNIVNSSNSGQWRFQNSTGSLYAVGANTQNIGWGTSGTIDTHFNHVSNGIIGVGTAIASPIAGGMQMATLAIGGATIGSNALAVTGTTALSGVLGVSNGTVGAPSIYPAVNATTGIWWRNANAFNLSFQGTQRFELGAGADLNAGGASAGLYMNGTNSGTANDTGVSRISAGIIGVGTGAAGSIAGGLRAATLALGGATIGTNALAVTGTANISGTIVTPTLMSPASTSLTIQPGSGGVINTYNQGGGLGFSINGTGLSVAGGQISILTNSTGLGVGIDVTTDGTAKFRNRAFNADAAITASSGTFSGALTVPGVTTAALTSTGTFTSGAGAQVGTLTNAPAAGNPTTWIKIIDNGTTRYIPAW